MTPLSTNVRELRKMHGMSQEYLARKLGISRPTLIRIEKGQRPLTSTEDAQIRDLFGITQGAVAVASGDIRISVPQKNIEKFRQVLLYVLGKTAGKPNIGMTALYKLLYFIDLDYYEKYEEQLMGLTYIKNHYGPTPREFVKVVEQMKKDDDIEDVKSSYFAYEQRKFLPHKEPDLSKLTGQELEMVDSVLERYGDMTAAQLTSISHEDTPWAVANDGEDIDYEHVFYRPEKLSVREYEPL
ncbi:MAG: type II toxin-antitoxin system antitoxin SocA domain-containing protein [Minisyncoccota bacterium]